jgi:hypothetical protein
MFLAPTAPQKQYAIWKALPGSQSLFLSSPVREVCFAGTRGPGKGLPLSETVYTTSGPRPIGELKVGDLVSCPDGTVSPITGVFPQGKRRVFKITFSDGAVARCDDQHIWNVHIADNSRIPAGTFKNVQMLELLEHFNTGWKRITIPTLTKLEMPMAENYVPMDAYLLGLMLGDGTFAQRMGYCTVDEELAQYVLANGIYEVSPDSRSGLRCFIPTQEIRDQVGELGLKETRSHTKFVPTVYLNNSTEVRLSVLQGLMDTDGTIDKKGYVTFCSVSEQLAKDVQYLARSLGAKATLTSSLSGNYGLETGVAHQRAYSVYIQTAGKFSPFRLQRKVDRIKPYMHKHLTNKMCSIEEQEPEETVCIKIAHPNGLFITNDFVVTHNTDAMLMAFAQYCGRGYGDYYRGIIFRRNYKHLDDIIAKSKRWFNKSAQQPRFLAGSSSLKWVWPTGEELLLRAFENEEDYWSYHGHEYPFIGWEELTSWPNINCYESMKSCNRSSFQGTARLPHLPRLVRSSTNPYGVGHGWVKSYFIDPAPYGKIITDKDGNQRCALFGSVKENPYLGEEYIKTLESITDANKRKAWLEGSWDITSGGMFDDLWDSTKHVLKPFDIPSSWRITRSFDWGSSKPFSCGWWAVSDGTEATLKDGRKIQFPRKTIFRIAEWYGCEDGKPNVGLRLPAKVVAQGIDIRERQMKIQNRVQPGPADSAIYAVTDEASIGQNMESEGVFWTPADKRPGSRKNGWELMRDRIDATAKGEDKPGFYVFDTCRDFIRTVPAIARDARDPDDVDTDAEDHIADDSRYMVLSADHTVFRVKIAGA